MQWYFDPMCYQLYLCAISSQKTEPPLCQHVLEMLYELKPCIEYYVEVSAPWSLTMHADNWMLPLTKANIETMYTQLSTNQFSHLQLMHLLKKLPRALAVQLSAKEARSMKERTRLFSSAKSSPQIDPVRICTLLSCPSPDLKGIYYPAKKFWNNFFSIEYTSTPVPSPQSSDDSYFRHVIYIQVPRVVFEHTTSGFTFQDSWKERLRDICNRFEVANGCIKLDATVSRFSCGIMNRFSSDISETSLPGYSWLLCITRHQLNALGGIGTVKSWNLFHQCTELNNGGAMLQLTEHVDIIERTVNNHMVGKLHPYLRFQPTGIMDEEIPISFRLSLETDDVVVVENNRYKLNLPI